MRLIKILNIYLNLASMLFKVVLFCIYTAISPTLWKSSNRIKYLLQFSLVSLTVSK